MPLTEASLAMPFGGRAGFARAAGLTATASAGRRVAADPVQENLVEAVRELLGVASRLEPRVGPVRRREREQRGGRVVEVAAQLAELAALAEERAHPLLVPPPLAQDLLAPRPFEVAPLLHEDRRDVQLVGHDAQVRPQRKPDLLDRPQLVRDRVEAGMEGPRSLGHRIVEQVMNGVDMGVERSLLDAERLRDLADRGAVVPLLREQPRGLAGELVTSGAHRS